MFGVQYTEHISARSINYVLIKAKGEGDWPNVFAHVQGCWVVGHEVYSVGGGGLREMEDVDHL